MTVELDYMVIGHVTRDLGTDGVYTLGGTVCYAARTAHALGCRVGVVTSTHPSLDLAQALPDVSIACVPAARSTTFVNVYAPNGRWQMVFSIAKLLTPEHVPDDWQAKIVHIGPIARECDPVLVTRFDNVFMGVTPQGWMRRWNANGCIHNCLWTDAGLWLARANAIVLSDEDVGNDKELIARYVALTRVLVVTHGVYGCTVYAQGLSKVFLAPITLEVDPTGAGDVFAAVYFVELQRNGDPWEAAHRANSIAAYSVTSKGLLASTPNPVIIGG